MCDEVVKLCLNKYSELGKNGKPREGEWTLLAGIVMEDNGSLEVISLATGTKCIGASFMSPNGDIVNDCHAEVLARRGFLRYLYQEVETALRGGVSKVFEGSSGVCGIKKGIKFHLYCSHVPCGDASIIPMEEPPSKKVKLSDDHWEDLCGQVIPDSERPNDSKMSSPSCSSDIHRTGAKCVSSDPRKDLKLPGVKYHTIGAVRTKPGRGDPTLSVSCSDKIAKWIFVGLQGALLSLLIKDKVQLSSITIGGGGQFSQESLKRALVDRSGVVTDIELQRSDLIFAKSRYLEPLANPCPTSIIWANVNKRPLEVAVEGRRLGATKKAKASAFLQVSKKNLFDDFIRITGEKYKGMVYGEVKSLSKNYTQNFGVFKSNIGAWTKKPNLLNFFSSTK